MRVFFIGSYPDRPTTGGHIYHHRMIEAIRELGYNVKIINASNAPGIFKSKLLNFMYPILLSLRNKPDIVIQVSDYAFVYILFSLFAVVANIPVIQVVHHLKESFQIYDLKSRINLLFMGFNLREAKCIIVNSKDTRDRVLRYSGIASKDKIEIINPGVVIKRKRVKERNYKNKHFWNLLSVGSITERKGYLFLIDALSNIGNVAFKSCIVGNIADGKYYSRLLKRIKMYKIDDKVKLTGYLCREELFALYEESDIFILPSLHEGYGIVLCEALCQALPIVATNVGAVPEIIEDKKTGLLVKPKSSKSIEDALKQLFANAEYAEKLSRNAIEKCSSIPTWSKMKKRVKKVVKIMLSKKKLGKVYG